MNISSLGSSPIVHPQPPVDLGKVQNPSAELSKDLLKLNVETMLSLGKMEYIGTIIDMYV